jgi:rhodanese-related sulfurtransferase
MQNISVQDLKAKIKSRHNFHLLDVREAEEKAEFDIGGKLFPLNQILAFQTDEIDDLKNEEVICYCRSGKRSLQACLMLETIGFTNVSNLSGGILAWKEATTD